jgi:hypothetical protein
MKIGSSQPHPCTQLRSDTIITFCKELNTHVQVSVKPKARLYDKRKNCGGAPPQRWGIFIPVTLHVAHALHFSTTVPSNAPTCMHERTTGKQRLAIPALLPCRLRKMTKLRESCGATAKMALRCRHWILRVLTRVLFYSPVDRAWSQGNTG